MRMIPSLILYNPLEAALLLWCVWLLRDKQHRNLKFNFKKFIIDSYILGTIFLFVQYPMNWMDESIVYVFYTKFIDFIIMPIFLFMYTIKVCRFWDNNQYNKMKSLFILIVYIVSMNFIVKALGFPFALNNDFFTEFKANIYIKAIQGGAILIIIFGGYILKKFLIKMAKNNIGKTIASTADGYGEQKLSKKLRDEINK